MSVLTHMQILGFMWPRLTVSSAKTTAGDGTELAFWPRDKDNYGCRQANYVLSTKLVMNSPIVSTW